MKMTKHSKKRMKERCGINKKGQERIVEKVLAEGISHNQTKGRLNKWISNLYFKNPQKGTNIKLYGDKAYIFIHETLITVLQIPPNLMRDFDKMIKKGEE